MAKQLGAQPEWMICDSDVLDCGVCMEAIKPPIFQCKTGHYVCSICMEKLEHKCHVCRSPINNSNRNLGFEKLLGSLKRKCDFSEQGCKKMPAYLDEVMHEKSCWYMPHACPLTRCSFRGTLHTLCAHFKDSHDMRIIEAINDAMFSMRIGPNEEYVAVCTLSEIFLFCCHDCHEVGKVLYISSFCFGPVSSSDAASSPKLTSASSSSPSDESDIKPPLSKTYTLVLAEHSSAEKNPKFRMSLRATIKKYQQSCNDVAGLSARETDFLLVAKRYFYKPFELFAIIESIGTP